MAPIIHTAVILVALALIGLGLYGLAPTLFRSRLGRLGLTPGEDDWESLDEEDLDSGPTIDPTLLPQTGRESPPFVMPRAWGAGPVSTALPSTAAPADATAYRDGPVERWPAEAGDVSDEGEEWPEDDEADEVLEIFREVLPARSPSEERRAALLQGEHGRVSIADLLADARLTARAVLGRPGGALQR